ncbi:MAG: hypothetical protein AB7D28_01935 [Candidatus Berkiella sp.]
MAGVIFALSMILILVSVGSLFAWMVHLASISKQPKPAIEAVKPMRI